MRVTDTADNGHPSTPAYLASWPVCTYIHTCLILYLSVRKLWILRLIAIKMGFTDTHLHIVYTSRSTVTHQASLIQGYFQFVYIIFLWFYSLTLIRYLYYVYIYVKLTIFCKIWKYFISFFPFLVIEVSIFHNPGISSKNISNLPFFRYSKCHLTKLNKYIHSFI